MTAPMIHADCDLRGMQHMPLLGERLLTSDFDARCNDAEWRAGVTLWWRAWQQVPAGSLPDDDAALAALAGYRRDPKGWQKIRANALHGFMRCDDGRLYHPVICELATVAWKKREAWRRTKAGQRAGHPRDVRTDVQQDTPEDKPVDDKRHRSVKGEGEGISIANAIEVEAAPPAPPPSPPKRKTRLPEDFHVPPDWLAWAIEDHGMLAGQVYEQAKRFTDHWRGTGEPKADWQATWRNWIRRAEDFDGKRPAGKGDRMLAGFAAAFSDGTG